MTLALQLTGIRKSFDGALALDGASFESRAGEVHALLGENGAGKSSLMNVAAGLYAPDAGSIIIDGVAVSLKGPADARLHGIGMVHQHFKLVKPFTIAENILLANRRPHFSSGILDIRAAIRKQADELKFDMDPDRRVGTLTVAERQQVEIVKVLVGGVRILILDEPTAVLTDVESEGLLKIVRRLAQSGTAVVLVTHKLQEVKRYADAVTIMRGGRNVATLDPRQASAERLTELTVGQTVALPARSQHPGGPTRLNVGALCYARGDGRVMLNNASFHVRGGEIYGLAGVSGNGQAELAEALIGANEPTSGEIWLDGVGDFSHASNTTRREAAIAAIPADRYAYALAGSLSISDNFAIAHIRSGRYGSVAMVNRSAMRKEAMAAVKDYDVQGVRSVSQKASLLSGGNAQKLVIAREFSREPKVVVAHSPSRGLDARACAAVHQRLIAARERGAAIVLISEDLDEILSLSDRIGVMTKGVVVAEFERPADRQAIGRAMVDHA
ncbi:ABC transporter ATP-binding protein [Tardiphaga sp. 42S5]|uniref:ABC transporter ATP-binding protein n=1 Tax=Tardiphaga sp. 42S5 TaxID=1404799 RepID=UPI002A59B6BF|nr:ABC transporter ATP-binding protein [Tardiphaga sp. 42S5]WPO41527.1 ABC transporter ATP-binding protein [Tardiphaga sp. 42S5]